MSSTLRLPVVLIFVFLLLVFSCCSLFSFSSCLFLFVSFAFAFVASLIRFDSIRCRCRFSGGGGSRIDSTRLTSLDIAIAIAGSLYTVLPACMRDGCYGSFSFLAIAIVPTGTGLRL